MQLEKLTCLKGPGKTSSNKITQEDKQEVAPGKKNVRTACPKDKLEFTFFSRSWKVLLLQRLALLFCVYHIYLLVFLHTLVEGGMTAAVL